MRATMRPGLDSRSQNRLVLFDSHGAGLSGGRAQASNADLLTGEPIDAGTALDWGLVNRVVPLRSLNRPCLSWSARSPGRARSLSRSERRAFYHQVDRGEGEAYEQCKVVMTSNALAHDAQEGMISFLQKRAPVWRCE
jgi:enoyl-CoA hydratase/carnithine racemase